MESSVKTQSPLTTIKGGARYVTNLQLQMGCGGNGRQGRDP